MPNFYTTNQGGAYNQFANPPVNVSLDNLRRGFGLSDKIAEIRPDMAPFFTWLAKMRKEGTNDPVFKMIEHRHQWQRRNFHVTPAIAAGTDITTAGIVNKCYYDARGRKTPGTEHAPIFFVPGQVLAIENVTQGGVTGTLYARVTNVPATGTVKVDPIYLLTATGKTNVSAETKTFAIPKGSRGQVIGTAYPEGSGAPDSWHDVMSSTEGYAQIFKTAGPLMSGSAMATEYRGVKNEFTRIWGEKMLEHKMDIEHAFLFGVGHVDTTAGALNAVDGTNIERYTWGVLPFVNIYGENANFSYAASGYNDFVDWSQEMFAPEEGNSGKKLVLASRKIVGWFNKLGNNSFLGNTLGNNANQLDIQNIKSRYGFKMTEISTVFGDYVFVQHPLLREQWEDYGIVIDPKNVAYRPLQGNGISRDTFVETNVQNNDTDGRKDQILTESGLQILLPETHAVVKWG